jgi:hypothetical protein
MKVRVPEDHGATEVVGEARDAVIVRPRRYAGDTYPSLWFWFQAVNDSDRDLSPARVVVEGLTPGRESYEPFWKHCLWSAEGDRWERIPDAGQQLSETSLAIETRLGPGEAVWIAATFPLPYHRYRRRCDHWTTSPAAGVSIRRRRLCHTVEGRPLYAFQIGAEGRAPDRHLLLIAGQHAVEQSGKIFAERVLDGYHGGEFAGTAAAALLATHAVTVVPLANPDGCHAGRMNTNAAGVVVDDPADNSVETLAVMALIDELRPQVLVNCHGWGNELGEPPYEDLYRWTDGDPLFAWLRERVRGCSTSSAPHWLDDRFRLECHARRQYATECAITELNWNCYLPPDGGPPRRPTLEEIRARAGEYFEAIARFCLERA